MQAATPFSLKVSGPHQWIKDDFPLTARTALRHLLYNLIDLGYLPNWIDIDKELRRLIREQPVEYDRESVPDREKAKESAETILYNMAWDKVFDFCERLYSYVVRDVEEWEFNTGPEIITTKKEIQEYLEKEIQRLIEEENLAYSFKEGEIHLRGRSHTVKQMHKAEPTLGDPRLNNARIHYGKALQYFQDSKKPDFENAVKEAVCAVEAACRGLFPDIKAKTLGEAMKRIRGHNTGQLPKTISDTITALYAFRNSGEGVAHGGSTGGKVTMSIAEYVISIAASQIILLHETASELELDVPF
ncbi:MAG: hypothetical protein MI802_28400 [Desulfobacterales bacterium]|nr:hypothetical protein [Desulfobacterales bacterium]